MKTFAELRKYIKESGEEGTIPGVTVPVNIAQKPGDLLCRPIEGGFVYVAVSEELSTGRYLCYEVVVKRDTEDGWYASKAVQRYLDIKDTFSPLQPVELTSIPLDVRGAVMAAFAEKGIALV